jgi:hypothetical protein
VRHNEGFFNQAQNFPLRDRTRDLEVLLEILNYYTRDPFAGSKKTLHRFYQTFHTHKVKQVVQ